MNESSGLLAILTVFTKTLKEQLLLDLGDACIPRNCDEWNRREETRPEDEQSEEHEKMRKIGWVPHIAKDPTLQVYEIQWCQCERAVLTTHICHGSIRLQDRDNGFLDAGVHSSNSE